MTGSATTALVIGATGTTGSRVAALFAAGGPRAAAAGTEAVRFDWYDPATHDSALDGAEAVYVVPPIGAASPADTVLPFLERARGAGVRRAVLLSSSAVPAGGPATGKVHAALPDVFDQWAVLRPSWFMQNFTGDHVHARTAREEGEIRTAAASGRVPFIDADDIAAVAARALTDEHAPNTDLVITGPAALSYDDAAAVLSEVTGRTVTHRRLTYEQMRDRLEEFLPAEFAAMLAGLDRLIAEGAEDRTTDTVERVTGRPPRDFRTHVERHHAGSGEPVNR